MKSFTVEKKDEGQTLIKYLRRILKSAGDSFIYKMLRKKNIVLDGKKALGKEVIREGDEIKLFLSDETFLKMSEGTENKGFIETSQRPLIIFEDEDIIVSSKPAGILSQKADETTASMNDILLSYLKEKNDDFEQDFQRFHPSVSNRLDRNTSGLIFFAKTYRGQKYLSEVLRERTLEKYYLAIVHGTLKKEGGFHAFLKKDEKENRAIVKEKSFEDSREIETGFETIKTSPDKEYSLISCELITGAPHQIRAHLSFLGNPVLFDAKYGDRDKDRKLFVPVKKRQMLHAERAVFPDKREFVAEIPFDFSAVLHELHIER